jgi:uncharacterized protein with von Willebrand factor type A (vWA) domain
VDVALTEFAEVLRQNGLPIGPGEVEDALRALHAAGLSDRLQVRASLEATLVKRPAHQQLFREAFEFYFSGAARAFAALDESLARRLDEEGFLQGEELKTLMATLRALLPGMNALTQATLTGDRARLARLFRGAALDLDFSQVQGEGELGFYARRLVQGTGGPELRADLTALEGELRARGLSSSSLEVVSQALAARLRAVEDAARKETERQARARVPTLRGGASTRRLATLTPEELERAQLAVRRLAEKLKSRLMRRALHPRRGALHVRETLRRNLSWGGVPMVPVFRDKRPERPDVVVLCDISDSVRNVSRLMLAFMHTLQSLVVRVRSFVFVSEVGEVTGLFKAHDLDSAIELAVNGSVVSRGGNSNYGQALALFSRRELASIQRRTTVVVIGDGRSNYHASGASLLGELKARCRRLVWICPEPRAMWGTGDSEMPACERQVHQVLEVQDLADLEGLADALLPV